MKYLPYLWMICISFKCAFSQDAPSAPQNITVVDVSSRLIDLAWTRPETLPLNVTQFRIIYLFSMGNYSETKTLYINDTSFRRAQIKELYPDILYEVQISEKTNVYGPHQKIYVKTKVGVPQTVPEKLNVENIKSSSAEISWTPIPKYLEGGNFTSYMLHILSEGEIFHKEYSRDTTNAVLLGLTPNTTYLLQLLASSSLGSSDRTIEATFKTELSAPSAPRNVSVVSVSSTTIELKWIAPSILNNVKFYVITVVNNKTGTILPTANVVAIKTSFKVEDLQPNTLYIIKVQAVNTEFSNFSDTVYIQTTKGVESSKRKSNLYVAIFLPICLMLLILVVVMSIIVKRRHSISKKATLKTALMKSQQQDALQNRSYDAHQTSEKHDDKKDFV